LPSVRHGRCCAGVVVVPRPWWPMLFDPPHSLPLALTARYRMLKGLAVVRSECWDGGSYQKYFRCVLRVACSYHVGVTIEGGRLSLSSFVGSSCRSSMEKRAERFVLGLQADSSVRLCWVVSVLDAEGIPLIALCIETWSSFDR
jgi:hypothetical protein